MEKMIDDEKALYTISVIADLIGEHPETLRVWERNGLIHPDRTNYQRRYSNNDIRRLRFIKYLIDDKGFNVASLCHLLNMYPCWYNVGCRGGRMRGKEGINTSRPCWKENDTFCTKVTDKADMCCCCNKLKNEDLNEQD